MNNLKKNCEKVLSNIYKQQVISKQEKIKNGIYVFKNISKNQINLLKETEL